MQLISIFLCNFGAIFWIIKTTYVTEKRIYINS